LTTFIIGEDSDFTHKFDPITSVSSANILDETGWIDWHRWRGAYGIPTLARGNE
jgi:hypothetical protein